MNILFVCYDLPYPLDGGCKIRMFNLLKHLARKHSISLLCYVGSGNQENYVREMKKFCSYIELVRLQRRSKFQQLPDVLRNVILGIPWNVKYARSKEMENAIREITKGDRFDLIHFDDIYIASNLDLTSKYSWKRAVTFHDIESIKYRRIFEIEKNLYNKIRVLFNWLPMERWERKIAGTFDLNIAVSSFDGQILKSKSGRSKVAIIPNGVDTDSLKILRPIDKEENISFFGIMDYPPNSDAALYFSKEILPLIKIELPNARFLIVGKNPNKELKNLSKDPRITVTGYVENVIPYYQKSSVVVVPLRAGSGTRGKILEAMALGRPVVSTSLGAEGLGVTHGENIVIADKPDEFANRTIELINNSDLRAKLINNARKFVEDHHSWQEIAKDLDRAYQEICN